MERFAGNVAALLAAATGCWAFWDAIPGEGDGALRLLASA